MGVLHVLSVRIRNLQQYPYHTDFASSSNSEAKRRGQPREGREGRYQKGLKRGLKRVRSQKRSQKEVSKGLKRVTP